MACFFGLLDVVSLQKVQFTTHYHIILFFSVGPDIYGLPDDSPVIAEVRQRLIFFLNTSTLYDAERIIALLPSEGER